MTTELLAVGDVIRFTSPHDGYALVDYWVAAKAGMWPEGGWR